MSRFRAGGLSGGPGTNGSAERAKTGLARIGGQLLFILVVAGLSVLLVWGVVPEVLDGQLVEPDNYMRLVRVTQLVETGNWYDNTIPRSNAPFGEVLHWTRPLDVLLLGGTVAFLPFLSFSEALHLSGVLFPPLVLILICYAVGWACIPLAGERFRFYGMITLLAQPGVVSHGLLGRVDHHALMFLLFAIVLGLVIRWVGGTGGRWSPAWAGAMLGLGLWVGPEFLLPIALVLGTGAAIWAYDGAVDAEGNRQLAMGLLVFVTVAWLLEHPPGRLLAEEYDRISAPHVLFAILAGSFWMVVARLEEMGTRRSRDLMTATGKSIVIVSGAVAAGGVMLLLYPSFFQSPTADIDPLIWALWRGLIEEGQSWVSHSGQVEIGNLVVHLGALVFCLPFLAWALVKERTTPQRWSWAFLALALVSYGGLALYMVRHVPYAEILLAIVTVTFLSRILPKLDPVRNRHLRTAARASTAAVLVTGPLFLGLALTSLGGETGMEVREVSRQIADRCPLSSLTQILSNQTGLGDRARTIVAHLDYGPEILYRTPHRVLGTLYHRNADGVRAGFAVLRGTDMDQVRDTVRARGVDLILVCPLHSRLYGDTSAEDADIPTLHDLLLSGRPPDWLERVSVPIDVAGEFRLFRVDESPR